MNDITVISEEPGQIRFTIDEVIEALSGRLSNSTLKTIKDILLAKASMKKGFG